MQTGTLTFENLTQVLRGIGSRKRHGVLEVSCEGRQLTLLFVQGEVVEASWDGEHPLDDLVRHLTRAGAAGEQDNVAKSLAELFALLSSEIGLDKQAFDFAVRERLLGRLEELNLEANCFYAFRIQTVQYEAGFSPAIQTAEVLEVLLHGKDLAKRVAQVFGVERYIKSVGEGGAEAQGLSDEERVILGLIQETLPLEEVKAGSMLSEYSFNRGLLGLLDRGLVRGEAPVIPAESKARPEASVVTANWVVPKIKAKSLERQVDPLEFESRLDAYWAAALLIGAVLVAVISWPSFIVFF